jgi:hypothetical protein
LNGQFNSAYQLAKKLKGKISLKNAQKRFQRVNGTPASGRLTTTPHARERSSSRKKATIVEGHLQLPARLLEATYKSTANGITKSHTQPDVDQTKDKTSKLP